MCRASKRGEDQPDIICAGLAQKSTSKAEDVCAVTITNDWSIAAVFDGHGGKIAAERCKNELVPTLLEIAHSDSSIIDAAAVNRIAFDEHVALLRRELHLHRRERVQPPQRVRRVRHGLAQVLRVGGRVS